jgi:type IV pilus assembly protein PilM
MNQALGIDIGPDVIKAVMLTEDDSALVVTHAQRIPTPPGSLDKGVVVGTRELIAILKKIVKQTGIKTPAAAVSIPAEQTTLRWIDLPAMDAETLREATPFEARKYLSYPIDTAEVRIVPGPIRVNGQVQTMRAMLVGVPKEIPESRAALLEAAGIDVSCLELEGFALVRALYRPDQQRKMLWTSHSLAYLQLGEDMSTTYVLQEGKLIFSRGIAWGSSRLTLALMEFFGCTADEARRIMENEGTTLNADGTLAYRAGHAPRTTDALVGEFDRLGREIQRLMSYYQSLFPDGSYEGNLNQITLCSGVAGLTGMPQYLGGRLDIACDTGDPFQARDLQLGPGVAEAVHGNRTSFAVATGLALGHMRHSVQIRQPADVEYIWRRPNQCEISHSAEASMAQGASRF